jgi:glycosyltransferase involved in cell wall biosynthesis
VTAHRPEAPRVSVVIRCLNEEEHIGRLLAGILQQTVADLEIVVVDSGSTDATLAIVERFPVRLLRISPGEFSFGRALNRGFTAAGGEFVVAASAHVYPVYRDWLSRLLEPFTDPQVALVYGKQRGDEGTRYSERRVFATWFPETSNPHQPHPFCNNANAAVRRSVWEKLPYDETLTGLEDLDWAKRAMAAGHRIAYAAGAEVIHVHRETARAIFNRYRREAMALARIQPAVRFGLADFLRLAGSSVISDLGHAWREARPTTIRDIAVFRTMQFWGTYRGFRDPGSVTEELKRRFYYPQGWPREGGGEQERREEHARIDYARTGERKRTDD